MKTACLLLAVLALGATSAAFARQQAAKPQQKWESEVKRLAQPLIDAGLVPGMSIGIYDQGRVETYGLTSPAAPAPSADTIYEIGSVSKVFTCLLLADAVNRGEVALEDPLSKFLPPEVQSPKLDDHEITLELLATHFSGLPRIPSNLASKDLTNPYAAYGHDQLFEFLKTYHLTRQPGAEYEYSNLGVGLLGTLLADKTKTDYESLLRTRITGPLHMPDTVVKLSDDQKRRLATPHHSGLPVSNWDFDALVGCGGIRSTVNDMLKLIAANVEPAGSPLEPAITLAHKHRRDVPKTALAVALGWHIAADKSTRWHNGQTGGYSSSVFVSTDLRRGVVVLANGADTAVDSLGEKIFQTVVGMKVEPPKTRASIALTDPQIDRLLGEYPSTLGFTITITRQDTAVMARVTGQQPLRIFPESPTRFFYRDVQAEIEFDIDAKPDAKSDRPAALTLFQNGREMRCERKRD